MTLHAPAMWVFILSVALAVLLGPERGESPDQGHARMTSAPITSMNDRDFVF